MELISLLILAAFVWMVLQRRKEADSSAEISPALAKRQLEYMRQMNTSPRLRGTGEFSLRVFGNQPAQENLKTIRAMLQQQYTVDSSFMALLKLESHEESKATSIAVYVGDEPVGLLSQKLVNLIASDLNELGGVALAEARLDGLSTESTMTLRLDLAIPIEIAT